MGNTSIDSKNCSTAIPHPQLCPCGQRFEEWMDSVPKMVKDVLSEFAQGIGSTIEEKVQKAVEKAFSNSHPRSTPHDAVPPDDTKPPLSRILKLVFTGTLPDELITWDSINTIGALLRVELLDSSGLRVEDGPESSVKIKIFVLNGDFEVDDQEIWTAKEFDMNIAQPRKDKGPLLKGKYEIVMKNGVAMFEDIAFTDNSKSMRNGKFRFGARVVRYLPEGVEIRDAVSTAFQVKERRVKFYRKRKTLSVEDSPDCLKHIGSTLAKKLASKGILTVQDFLQLYHADEQALKDILHLPENKWKELVEELAQLFPLPQKLYKHSDDASEVNIKPAVINRKITNPSGALDDPQQQGQINTTRFNTYHEKQKQLQESDTPTSTTPRGDDFRATSTTLQLGELHQVIHPLMQHGLGSGSNTPHSSRQTHGMGWEGQDICSIPSSQTHQEIRMEPNQLQGSHTPIQDEVKPSSSTISPSTSQQADATADIATMLTVHPMNPMIGMERGGQQISSMPLHQTFQGEQGLHYPAPPGHDADVQHMVSAFEQQIGWNMPELPEPESPKLQLPVDQGQCDHSCASDRLPDFCFSDSDLDEFGLSYNGL